MDQHNPMSLLHSAVGTRKAVDLFISLNSQSGNLSLKDDTGHTIQKAMRLLTSLLLFKSILR